MPDPSFCPKCGATVDGDAAACRQCGADLRQGRTFADAPDPARGSGREIPDAVILGAYALGAIGVLFLPLGLVGVGLGWWARRNGHPKGRKAMIVAAALTLAGLTINLALIGYCQTSGAGTELCAPYEEMIQG